MPLEQFSSERAGTFRRQTQETQNSKVKLIALLIDTLGYWIYTYYTSIRTSPKTQRKKPTILGSPSGFVC
jgi:glucose uptake protein GlcU